MTSSFVCKLNHGETDHREVDILSPLKRPVYGVSGAGGPSNACRHLADYLLFLCEKES